MAGLILGQVPGASTHEVIVDSDGRLMTGAPYLVDVAKGNVPGASPVNKFGYNTDVPATLEEIWDYSEVYEYLADDTFATMYISSDDTLDQGLTYEVTGIDSDYNYSTVTVTTDGADGFVFVPLTSGATDNKWWRIVRAKNTSGTAAQGNIYISKDNTDAGGDGIPDTVTDIQAEILIGMDQTLMALWTVPVGKTAYVTNMYASTSSAKVTEVRFYYRPFGGVFNIKHIVTINASTYEHEWKMPLSFAAKGDIKVMASAATGGGKVAAGFSLWYE